MNARQKKALYFQKLQNILEEYNKIFVVEIKPVPSKNVLELLEIESFLLSSVHCGDS